MGAWIAGHRKGILGYLAALGGICTIVASLTDLGPVAKYAGVIVAVLAGVGVYHAPNAQPQPAGDQAHGAAPAGHTQAP